MSQFFTIHPENPQPRLISQTVDMLRKGAVIVYPTDSGYALGCRLEDKTAMERICRIRKLDGNHNFTLVCRDLSELSTYAHVDNQAFHLMKNNTPGKYSFILKATKEVPRRLMNDNLGELVDLVIHGGFLGQQPTTVIDLTDDTPVVVRNGVGDISPFL